MIRVLYLVVLISLCLSGCGGTGSDQVRTGTPANDPAEANTLPDEGVSAAKTVMIESPDGVRLVGTFLETSKPNSPAVLLLHQWQSDRHSYDEFAKRMQARGFAVLSIDGRGFGESTKKADGSEVKAGRTDADVKGMLGDVDAAFEFLSKQKNVDPANIGIVGASYGSSLAIIYAAKNQSVRAVVLISPGLNYFGNMPIEPVINRYGDRSLLLVAAEDDKESADAVRKMKSIKVDSPRFSERVYPKGGHGTALLNAGADQDIGEFLTNDLKR